MTADNKEFLLAVGNDRQFRDLCKLLRLDDVPSDSLFQTNESRVRNRQALNEILGKAILEVDSIELLKKVNNAKIPAGLIRSVDQVFEMPEAKELLLQCDNVFGVRTFVSDPVSLQDSHLPPPPHLGEHTTIILAESLKYSSEMIMNLRSAGIVG